MVEFNSKLCSLDDTFKRNNAMAEIFDWNIGPLVDDCSAYNEIGEVELKLLQTRNTFEDYELEPNPFELNQWTYW